MSDTFKKVAVVIPEGSMPGSTINVRTDDERLFAVTIPPGYEPGQSLIIEIQDDAEGGATVVIADDGSGMTTGAKASLGAAAVGAVIGCLLIGPITGVVVGGAALYASTRNDDVGKAARAAGGVAVQAASKTAEVAEKYHIKEKVVAAGTATYNKAKEINNEYKLTDKIKSASSGAVEEAKKLNDKYDITGKTSRAFVSGARSASAAISKMGHSNTSCSPTVVSTDAGNA